MSDHLIEQASPAPAPVARLQAVGLSYGKTVALEAITLDMPAGSLIGLIGPDGVGKSSLLSLIAGARVIQSGKVEVLGGDMADARVRRRVCPRIAYMPQGLGKNLYPTLSVFENVDFFGRLFGHRKRERERRIRELLQSTGLAPFADRPVGKLSGGMKQKLGLCCSLIHNPDLLILDEPTTGVDPLSRRQFWEMISEIRRKHAGITVVVSSAYLEEAATFDWLVAMDDGRVLSAGAPAELLQQTRAATLDAAFIALLPEQKRRGHSEVAIPPRSASFVGEVAIEAEHLTMRFDDFTAVDDVSFRIERGEIFGFVGSNGCGKTTTMKMLTGLLPASSGNARLFGREFDPEDMNLRRLVGYMSQAFSLYSELTVQQNLELHARLFRLQPAVIPARIGDMARRFNLTEVMGALPDELPVGIRQRLSLAVAMIHSPEILILDEPTSGVDPIARDGFWQILTNLSRKDNVTVFISTHFMNEAERCDRVSLMHAGKVLVTDTPGRLVERRSAANLEQVFISCLEDAIGENRAAPLPLTAETSRPPATSIEDDVVSQRQKKQSFSPQRMLAYARREGLELRRDPIRAALAMFGSIILMFVMGYGVNLDVEKLTFAVLDRDDTTLSRDYVLQIAGSRYFRERAPITDYADLDRRMSSGELSLALEIPPGFGRDVARGRAVAIGAWIDGAMPLRADSVNGYVQAMHAGWLAQRAREALDPGANAGHFRLETRYRYNPDVKSVVAMVPATIPLVLLMIPAMLAALSVVREKELGSIVNFYVTPVTRFEFLVGKQVPYVVVAMVNSLLLLAFATFAFHVPFTGSFFTFAAGAFLYVIVATAMGLVVSTFLRSQVAAIFGTALSTLIPAIQFSGLMDPVSSLRGLGAFIGQVYPTTYFLNITRGTFSKALAFGDLSGSFLPLFIAIPILLGLAAALLRKQAS